MFGFNSVLPAFLTNYICCERLFTASNSHTFVLTESKSVLKLHFKTQSSSLASDLPKPFLQQSYYILFPQLSTIPMLVWSLCDVSGTCSFCHWLITSCFPYLWNVLPSETICLGHCFNSCTEDITKKSVALYYAIAPYGSGDSICSGQSGLSFVLSFELNMPRKILREGYLTC